MEEILHLIDGKHPIIYRVSTILLVVQDFATIHSGYGKLSFLEDLYGFVMLYPSNLNW